MAGPSIGTWVKVRNKSGRTTARVIANKFGGGSYQQGQVITQSEYEGYKAKRAEAMKEEPARAVPVEVVADRPRGKSRFQKLIDDVSSNYAKEEELQDRALGITAKVATKYVKTLADAGVTPQASRSPKQLQAEVPALPGTARKKGSRFSQLISDMDALDTRQTKNLARTLGVAAQMAQTTKDLESRRGQGRKKVAGKKKTKKLNGNQS